MEGVLYVHILLSFGEKEDGIPYNDVEIDMNK